MSMMAMLSASSSGRGINPSLVPGVLGRIRADSGIHPATGVDVWTPVNGGATYVQASGAAQPTFSAGGGPNGRPCVVFNGSSHNMVSAFTYAKPQQIYVVGKWASTAAVQATMIDGVTANTSRLGRRADGITAFAFNGSFCNLAATTITDWHIYRLQFGATQATGAIDAGAYAPASAASGNTSGGLTLGMTGGGGEFGNISIAEVIPYSRLLDAVTDAKITAYLRSWYAL